MPKLLKLSLAIIAVTLSASANAQFGPISKWERDELDEIDAQFVSPAYIYDIERCLMDLESMPGVPNVYWQPDRPNQRQLVWSNGDSNITARADLEKLESGTRVTSWRVRKKNREGFDICVPKNSAQITKPVQ